MKDQKILVSIIVPIYNVDRYLEKCLDSILGQTYRNLQILLIDDGSTDRSGDICDWYAEKDIRIEVRHTKNKGLVAARKYGIESARGEYIGFVDGDDYIASDMFQELLRNALTTGADFVHSGFIQEKNGIQKIACDFEESVVQLTDIAERQAFLCRYFLEGREAFIYPSIWSKLFKADFIRRCYSGVPETQQYGEDLLCLIRSIFEGSCISLFPKAMYYYALKERSLSQLEDDERMMKEIGLWHYMVDTLAEYGCLEAIREAVKAFIQSRMLEVLEATGKNGLRIPRYFFPDMQMLLGKTIVLYGAGRVGQGYYAQISKYTNCTIAAWIDRNWQNCRFDYAEIVGMERLRATPFDILLIAVNNGQTAMQIRNDLVEYGIPETKICWREPGRYL